MFGRKKKYDRESVETALRIMRSHIGGMADRIGTLSTLVQGIDQRQRDELVATAEHRERVERSLTGLHAYNRDQAIRIQRTGADQ